MTFVVPCFFFLVHFFMVYNLAFDIIWAGVEATLRLGCFVWSGFLVGGCASDYELMTIHSDWTILTFVRNIPFGVNLFFSPP